MNDLEICKRIAEIEFDDLIDCYEHKFDGICIDKPMCGMVFREAYNPLTDDALCFQLMIKYCVDFNHAMFTDNTLHRYQAVNTITRKGWGLDKNPNKAICLAIIEIYK